MTIDFIHDREPMSAPPRVSSPASMMPGEADDGSGISEGPGQGTVPSPTDRIVVVNKTGRRIGIDPERPRGDQPPSSAEMLVLPPFGERELSRSQLDHFDTDQWAARGLIEVREPEQKAVRVRLTNGLWTRLGGVVALVALGLELPSLRISTWYWLGVTGLALWFGAWGIRLPRARTWISRVLSFWVVLAVGIGIPFAAQWLASGGMAVLGKSPQELVGRAAQLAFVSIAAVLPALLYYLFDRQQLATLRESFFRRVIELQPKILTVDDAKSTYGGVVAEVYGHEEDGGGRSRFSSGSRLPILIATVCLTVGWLLVLPPLATYDPSASFRPEPTAVSYGFLGAYFFCIGMIVRRYTRADLKPKTYGNVTVRLLLTTVLVWALSALPVWDELGGGEASPYLLLMSFMVGIVPDTGLMIIRQFLASGKLLRARIDSLDERLPLSKIDGVTLYDQARLAEEGIENIQNLVYHDLIDLVLQTRVPLHRLIDWVDQGILIMHLDGRDGHKSLETLRKRGIRNASDLVATCVAAHHRGDLSGLVEMLGRDESTGICNLQLVYDALQNDEWFESIVLWRDRARLPGEHVFGLEEMFLSHEELCQQLGLQGMLRPKLSARAEADEEIDGGTDPDDSSPTIDSTSFVGPVPAFASTSGE